MISDYSGVVFDFLYLKKPIILYVPDYDEFLSKNGFNLNIVESKISKVVKTFDDLKDLIEKNNLDIKDLNISKNVKKMREEVFPDNNREIKNILDKISF